MSQTIEFDEQWYLLTNPDVARAVADGGFPSGYYHYALHGQIEGRRPCQGAPSAEPLRPAIAAPPHRAAFANSIPPPPPGPPVPEPIDLRHRGTEFLTPTDLSLTQLAVRKILAIGSCHLEALCSQRDRATFSDVQFLVSNNLAALPLSPGFDPAGFDLQIIQVALRSLWHDDLLWHLPHGDRDAHAAALQMVCRRLAVQLDLLLRWNRQFGLPTFVINFPLPQENPAGRLLPRYHLSNPVYVVEQINVELERLLGSYRGVHLLDVDKIAASIGRRYVQDDSLTSMSHNSVMDMLGANHTRIEPLAAMAEYYELNWSPLFVNCVWAEVAAMVRTLRQVDPVKLVVVDLDDTLWNGVSGELEDFGPQMLEGWPLGVAEALAYLRKRGTLLAIISKNDDTTIRSKWERIFGSRLRLADFVSLRINWEPKPDNMRQILSEVNLLPRNVLFVDDNPVEREAMRQAFPDMRIIGRHPYYLRRVLLWAPETQVPSITEESSRRTAMVQAQIERETLRDATDRDSFIRSLNVQLELYELAPDHARFPRAFELLNKTNQFNTTGKRWQAAELADVRLLAFDVRDRIVDYGLVGVIIVEAAHISQFVMSCRVVGLDAEITAMAKVIDMIRATTPARITATLLETDTNLPCRDLFARCGFAPAPEGWCFQ
jgi:FkbH-like protein